MQTTNDLQQHRESIDNIDEQILKLINQRAEHAHAIGKLKNSTAYCPERESLVLQRISELNTGPLPNNIVTHFFRAIMSMCLSLQKPLIISFLGPQGTFSQAAATKHFGYAAQLQPCATIDEVFRQAETAKTDYAVVPVENSTEGAVGRTMDLLLQTKLNICGEITLPIHQFLLRKIPELKGIRKIYSHAQSLAQCQGWLNTHLPNIDRVQVASNAEAARLASEDENSAAIAGETAAEIYNLHRLANNIEDETNNTTRFLIMGNNVTVPTGRDRTSIIISAKNQPGAVYHLLAPLASSNINLTKLESRPSRVKLWEYVFFIDIDGHQQDAKIKNVLAALVEQSTFMKVLGSYPVSVL